MEYDRYRTLDDDHFDCVVIGAGLGGLSAAALLSRIGRKVLVLDQHAVPGGNATHFKRSGYEFDVGVHYIGGCHPGGTIPLILQAAGAGDIVFEEMDPDGFDTLVFPDFLFRVPKGLDRYRERLVQFFPGDIRGIDRFSRFLRYLEQVQKERVEPRRRLGFAGHSLQLRRWARHTFAEFLDSCTGNPWLRAVLAGQNGDYALPPSRASVLMGLGLILHYLQGAYYPRGGGQAISDRLAAAIEESGGKLLLQTRVERIKTANRRVEGVEASSKHLGQLQIRATTVLSNADLKKTMLELLDAGALRQRSRDQIRDFEMAPALAMLYLGYDRDLRDRDYPVTNYWIYPNYDLEAPYAEVAEGRLPAKPAVYVSIATLKDPANLRIAPPGVTNLQVMSVAPHEPESWGISRVDLSGGAYRGQAAYLTAKQQFGDRLIAAAARVLPDLSERIVFREMATPLTQSRYTGSTQGTAYGLAATPQQFWRNRPAAGTDVDGLYLCGSNTRAGHGISGVLLSGLLAAAAIGDRNLTRQVLRGDSQLFSR